MTGDFSELALELIDQLQPELEVIRAAIVAGGDTAEICAAIEGAVRAMRLVGVCCECSGGREVSS
jgi:hypothetical protein